MMMMMIFAVFDVVTGLVVKEMTHKSGYRLLHKL